jgi:hypothetical protein
VEAVRELDASGRIAYVKPRAPLAVGTDHVVVAEGLEDLAGNSSLRFESGFATGFESDAAAPVVLGVHPADGEDGVPINVRITIQMSEPVDVTSVTAQAVELREGLKEIDWIFKLEDGGRRVDVIPRNPLAGMAAHELRVQGLRDVAGNVQVISLASAFTTGSGPDLANPYVTRSNPAHTALGMAHDVVLTAELSESVNPFTVNERNVLLREERNGTLVKSAVALDASRRMITMTPVAPLLGLRSYSFVVTSNVRDTAGNPLYGFGISFTTSP